MTKRILTGLMVAAFLLGCSLAFNLLCACQVPLKVTENSNCVILNGAKRSEESRFYAG
jgi:hypothetical protein